MFKQAGTARAALLGTLCALVAFTYAIASVPASFDSVDSRAGAAGTNPLRFTNPKVPSSDDRDLGDVVLGSAFTRFARAAGGLPPYKFSSANISGLVGSILQSGAVDFSGKVAGSVVKTAAGPIADVGGSIRFNITVAGSASGGTLTEQFRLSVDSTGKFKFANDGDLGSAPRFADFSTQIDTINGSGTVTFAATAVSGITGVTKLSDAGLFLDSTGKIIGKPFVAGTLSITVEATDSLGKKAASRAGTGSNQVFTLVIEPSLDITSDFTATKVTVKTTGQSVKDSVSLAGQVNLKGVAPSALSGKKLALQVNNVKSVDVTLDTKGKGATAKGVKTDVVKASINTKGQVKIAFSKTTISSLTGFTTTARLLTGITLTDSVSTSDPLDYAVKGTSPKQTFTYSIGKNTSPAGAFIVSAVTGKDAKDGSGTAYKVDFLALSPSVSFGTATKATVTVGSAVLPTVNVTAKGNAVSAKGDKKQPVVASLKADGVKGKGQYTTGVLPASLTGIPLAGATTTVRTFATSLLLSTATTDIYSGVGGPGIKGTGKNAYTSAPKN